jgi:hypothetical protein
VRITRGESTLKGLHSVGRAQSQKKTSADAADFADKEEEGWFRFASGEPLDALQILFSLICVIGEICGYLSYDSECNPFRVGVLITI